MKISLDPASAEEKPVVLRLLELYNYDFSEFSLDDVDSSGCYGYPYGDAYWTEDDRFPFLIRADGKLCGLVLVRSCCEYHTLSHPHCIAEFFVLKKYRRLGVGSAAASAVFDRFQGNWEVSIWENNLPARLFWKKIIQRYTNGHFSFFVREEHHIVGYTFSTSGGHPVSP